MLVNICATKFYADKNGHIQKNLPLLGFSEPCFSQSTCMSVRTISIRYPVFIALALSIAAAIALGMSRFSYGLLMPPMRADLSWSYFLAGAMNSGNAFGYFVGALATSWLMRRCGVWRLLVIGSAIAGFFMVLTGLVTNTSILFLLRICAGIASAFIFITGGILAARLGTLFPGRSGFLIGLYYGGTGFGIILSALIVPSFLALARLHHLAHGWQLPWLALGILCLFGTLILAFSTKAIGEPDSPKTKSNRFKSYDFAFGLSGYFMFGVGYIGYMTFVIALLKTQGLHAIMITWFYSLLGLAVVVSARIWAPMFERFRGGESLAILNCVLGVACILPALSSALPVVFISGGVFGGVFLSVVAATTILVRHNVASESWSVGITNFTIVFALGQIIGPTIIGLIADGPGGLAHGLMASALALFVGAALAAGQKPLVQKPLI